MNFWQLYLVAFAVLFVLGPLVVRTALLWKATGKNPLFLEDPQTAYGFVQSCVTLTMIGFGISIACYAFFPAAHAHFPVFTALQTDPVRWAGVAVSALGLLITWIAQSQMGDSWRFGPDRKATPPLVTRGIFAVCRNPIYLSMMLAATGMFLLVPDALAFAMWLLSIVVLNTLVRLEEQFLQGVHGQPYWDYIGRVGRFLPGLGLLKQPH